jgi:hypothetical protein
MGGGAVVVTCGMLFAGVRAATWALFGVLA